MKCSVCKERELTGRQTKYCSKECKEKARPLRKKLIVKCQYDGEEFLTNDKRQRFCSRSHASKYQMERRNEWGERNPNWKPERNGTYVHTKGYLYQKKSHHPMADKAGNVMVHRKVLYDAEPFDKSLQVHHRDKVRTNNFIVNLDPKTAREHALLHAEERRLKLPQRPNVIPFPSGEHRPSELSFPVASGS